jgi:hypothetical protein
MIKSLMDQGPKACECGAPLRKAVAGRKKCVSCGAECDLPSGDDLNQQWVREYYQREFAPLQQQSIVQVPDPECS